MRARPRSSGGLEQFVKNVGAREGWHEPRSAVEDAEGRSPTEGFAADVADETDMKSSRFIHETTSTPVCWKWDTIPVRVGTMNSLNSDAESVVVIVDPDFGEKLKIIPAGRPVWITMSFANDQIVRSLWEIRGSGDHLTGITGFRFDGEISAEDRFLAELDAIDLHHGPYSSTSPCAEIAVMGARLSAEIRTDPSNLGFMDFREAADCFAARRTNQETMRPRE